MMGQYKLSFYFLWQIGFMLMVDDVSIQIGLPFVLICIGLHKKAEGIRWFREKLEDRLQKGATDE
jgi:hypothetical protein